MNRSAIMSRKNFLRLLNALIITFFIYIWNLLVRRSDNSESSQYKIKISPPISDGVTFYDSFYLYVSGQSVKAYSTRCTHAGCKINKEIKGQIVCPCHGSRYDSATGDVIKGPAQLPLKELSCNFDSRSKQWIISENEESTL